VYNNSASEYIQGAGFSVLVFEKEEAMAKIEIQVSEQQKELIEQAAALSGLDLSTYVLNTIVPMAQGDMEDFGSASIPGAYAKDYEQLLENESEPNEALVKTV
jgi:uncharacterized protein (DUF1778 family)